MAMEIVVVSLGLTDYLQAWQFQQTLHARCQKTGENIVIVTEHYPVVTLGYRGNVAHLRLSRAELVEKGIALVASERGGSVTYHGPGQLVVYPIFSTLLRHYHIRSFITQLEAVMCYICGTYGVQAERKIGFPGVWVQHRKIGAVGIAVRRGTSLHGFSLNISLDLTPFSYIVPCGLFETELTSLTQEVNTMIDMSDIVRLTSEGLQAIFSVPVKEMDHE